MPVITRERARPAEFSEDLDTVESEPVTDWGRPRRSVTPRRRQRRSRGFGKVLGYSLVGVLAVGGVSRVLDWLPSALNPFKTTRTDSSGPALLERLENLTEYRAATGHFQQVIKLDDDVRFMPSPVAGESVEFLAVGQVDASVDLSQLDSRTVNVSDDGASATIYLPPAELGDAYVNPDESSVLDRDRGLFNRVAGLWSESPTSERELYVLAEQKLEAVAADTDLLQRAEDNTEQMLQSLVTSLGFDELNVVYTDSVPAG